MAETRQVKNLYLWCIPCVYLFAFCSLYTQIPGLYGHNGILPLRSFAQIDERGENGLIAAMKAKPSLVWLAPKLGISLPAMMELITLSGIILSALAIVFQHFRTTLVFCGLYTIYFSLFQVGQTFLSFQWDILLLETGFLTIFVAPVVASVQHGAQDRLSMWLVRWLFFRFMFANGIVKLTSQCPTWWGLTSLFHHFESQCIPTQFGWVAHQLPKYLLKLGVVWTFVVEIAAPFLFLAPIAHLRLLAFWIQILFQLNIMLTGNYNFFNILTMVLSLSLLDDDQLQKINPFDLAFRHPEYRNPYKLRKENEPNKLRSFLVYFTYFTLIYWTVRIFNIKMTEDELISSDIKFSMADFDRFLIRTMPVSVAVGVVSLLHNIGLAYSSVITENVHVFKKATLLLKTTMFSCFALWLFSVSLVPHTENEISTHRSLWPILHKWHRDTRDFHIANSYGLFRRMTGLGGRPELIIEGSNELKSGWKEYNFLYKPGNLSHSPAFIIPHQPRLDWQMWFAALGSYQNNPWLLSFVNRLLQGQKDVLDLMDKNSIPFKTPPKFIRARLYIYQYTKWGDQSGNWWTRTVDHEYMHPVSIDSLAPSLKSMNINPVKKNDHKVTSPRLTRLLGAIRKHIGKWSPTTFIYGIFASVMALTFLG